MYAQMYAKYTQDLYWHHRDRKCQNFQNLQKVRLKNVARKPSVAAIDLLYEKITQCLLKPSLWSLGEYGKLNHFFVTTRRWAIVEEKLRALR